MYNFNIYYWIYILMFLYNKLNKLYKIKIFCVFYFFLVFHFILN